MALRSLCIPDVFQFFSSRIRARGVRPPLYFFFFSLIPVFLPGDLFPSSPATCSVGRRRAFRRRTPFHASLACSFFFLRAPHCSPPISLLPFRAPFPPSPATCSVGRRLEFRHRAPFSSLSCLFFLLPPRSCLLGKMIQADTLNSTEDLSPSFGCSKVNFIHH